MIGLEKEPLKPVESAKAKITAMDTIMALLDNDPILRQIVFERSAG